MKHPVIKLFLARLRALAAVERAAYPVLALPAMLTPFARHAIRIEEGHDGAFRVIAEGEAAAALFGRSIVGAKVADLFQAGDGGRLDEILAGALTDRMACVLGAQVHHNKFRATAVEAMLTPEPAQPGAPRRLSLCVIAFGFRKRGRARSLPALSLLSARFVDLDGFAGAPRLPPSTLRPLRRG